MKKLSALCLALLLTACGGSGGSDAPFVGGPTTPPGPPPTAPNPVTMDQFFTRVLALIGVANDEDDVILLDDILVTAPDDTDPVPLT